MSGSGDRPAIASAQFVRLFLYFGYSPWPGPESRLKRWGGALCAAEFQEDCARLARQSATDHIKKGISVLGNVFDDLVASPGSGDRVVTLSGGLSVR